MAYFAWHATIYVDISLWISHTLYYRIAVLIWFKLADLPIEVQLDSSAPLKQSVNPSQTHNASMHCVLFVPRSPVSQENWSNAHSTTERNTVMKSIKILPMHVVFSTPYIPSVVKEKWIWSRYYLKKQIFQLVHVHFFCLKLSISLPTLVFTLIYHNSQYVERKCTFHGAIELIISKWAIKEVVTDPESVYTDGCRKVTSTGILVPVTSNVGCGFNI